MVQIDHIGIAARDPEASARRLARILGVAEPTPDGADDDMFRIDLAHGMFVLFNHAEKIDLTHMAFRVGGAEFQAVVERLKNLDIPFGNDPEDPRNGQTDDQLGGNGRVYFVSEDGHLFEVTC